MAPARPKKTAAKEPALKAAAKSRINKSAAPRKVSTVSRKNGRPSKAAPRKSKPAAVAEEEEEEEEEGEQEAEAVEEVEANANRERRAFKAPRLKARIRTVPRSVINTWRPLSDQCQEDIMAVVKLAERPVLIAFANDRRRAEAQRATQKLIARIQSKLRKIPVPLSGKDARLSQDIFLDKKAEAEAILEPTRREVAELERELQAQKAALRNDEEHRDELKRNAKREEMVRAEKSRGVPRPLRIDPKTPEPASINLAARMELRDSAAGYKAGNDRQIAPVVSQLEQKLYSLQSNAEILGDIPDWIQRSRGAVEEVLVRAEDRSLYGRVAGL